MDLSSPVAQLLCLTTSLRIASASFSLWEIKPLAPSWGLLLSLKDLRPARVAR